MNIDVFVWFFLCFAFGFSLAFSLWNKWSRPTHAVGVSDYEQLNAQLIHFNTILEFFLLLFEKKEFMYIFFSSVTSLLFPQKNNDVESVSHRKMWERRLSVKAAASVRETIVSAVQIHLRLSAMNDNSDNSLFEYTRGVAVFPSCVCECAGMLLANTCLGH